MTRQRTVVAASRGVLPSKALDGGLSVAALHTTFSAGEGVPVIRGVDFDIRPGRTLVILGESGSGKSVTARSILRLLGPTALVTGEVLLASTDLVTLPDRAMRTIRGRRIGFVPQDPAGALSPLRRVGAQLSEVIRTHGVVKTRKEAAARAIELLARVGIPNPQRAARSHPHELSGGMRQRVAIALAIACEPPVLIADEPTTALDVTVQAEILDLFEELQERLQVALLLVTHDVGVAERMADDIAVMYAGRIVERGPAETVLRQPGHPYTRALLRALPRPDRPRGSLDRIPGQPPAPGALPPGCTFGPRCPLVTDHCRAAEPPLTAVADARETACLRSHELLGAKP